MSAELDNQDYRLAEDETRCNLIIVLSPAGLLMGMKTRGFGAGKLVLPGGKEKFFGPDFTGKRPSVEDVKDELFTETGLGLPIQAFIGVGYLYVEQADGENRNILLAKSTLPHSPKLVGSDELENPAWYPIDALPYERMPLDYQLWLPSALGDYMITGFLRNIDTDFAGSEIFGQRYLPELGRLEILATGPVSVL